MASTPPPDFGPRLAWTRKRRGLTQAQLARHLDVREKDIGRWEAAENFPRGRDVLVELATVLDVSTDFLLCLPSAEFSAERAAPVQPAGDDLPSGSDVRRRRDRGSRRGNGASESNRRRR